MTSHRQPVGNTPCSCPSSSTPPAHTDQPTQRSSGQQGASPVTHLPKRGPKGPGSILYRCVFPTLRTEVSCRRDDQGTSAAGAKAPTSPPASKGKGREVVNIFCWPARDERPCIHPGGRAGARGESGQRSTGGVEKPGEPFGCEVIVLNLAWSRRLIKRCQYTAPIISWCPHH